MGLVHSPQGRLLLHQVTLRIENKNPFSEINSENGFLSRESGLCGGRLQAAVNQLFCRPKVCAHIPGVAVHDNGGKSPNAVPY